MNEEKKSRAYEAQKRWRARNPEKWRKINSESNRKWREKNPERYIAQYEKDNKKGSAKKSIKRIIRRSTIFVSRKLIEQRKPKIIEMINRGRDLIFISTITGLAINVIAEIKKQVLKDAEMQEQEKKKIF